MVRAETQTGTLVLNEMKERRKKHLDVLLVSRRHLSKLPDSASWDPSNLHRMRKGPMKDTIPARTTRLRHFALRLFQPRDLAVLVWTSDVGEARDLEEEGSSG